MQLSTLFEDMIIHSKKYLLKDIESACPGDRKWGERCQSNILVQEKKKLYRSTLLWKLLSMWGFEKNKKNSKSSTVSAS